MSSNTAASPPHHSNESDVEDSNAPTGQPTQADGLVHDTSANISHSDSSGATGGKPRSIAHAISKLQAVSRVMKSNASLHVKVYELTIPSGNNDSPVENGATPVANILLDGAASGWIKKRLEDLRPKLKVVGGPFHFCEEDGSKVADNITLGAYFQSLETPLTQYESKLCLYISRDTTKNARTPTKGIFSNPPFLLKFVQLLEGESLRNEGSLHSSSLRGHDAAQMHLRELRRLVKSMSQDVRKHEFCLTDGTAITDDVVLQEYVSMMNDSISDAEGPLVITIAFRKTGSKSRFSGADDRVLGLIEKMEINAKFKDRNEPELQRNTDAFKAADHEKLDSENFKVSEANEAARVTADMDENDWYNVIRSCNLMFGWRIDSKTNTIVRAPKPAFKLRSGVNMPKPPPLPANNTLPRITNTDPHHRRSKKRQVHYEDNELGDFNAFFDDFASSSDHNGNESDASHESQGEDTDESDGHTEDWYRGSIGADDNSEESSDEYTTRKSKTSRKSRLSKKLPIQPPVPLPLADKPSSFPSFVVNDSSKVEVVMVEHEFQQSMAQNHFTSTSFEASASGGYAGFSASASGAVGSESEKGKSEAKKSFQKTMVASYKFPRVTVFLTPEDLEPTDELKSAINLVEKTKNINNLRKLHATFGHLFCQQVILGGCLQSSKTTSGDSTESENTQKEKFKASVGVAVSTPIGVGGGMKAEHETSDTNKDGKKDINLRESVYFEATGGNTILASNPPMWCTSVLDFKNWRVIEQSELTPLADAISQHPDYVQVREWFLQAVPSLSKYIVIPDSRSLDVRLKVCIEQDGISRIIGKKIQTYLTHDPEKPPRPLRMGAAWRETSTTLNNDVKRENNTIIMDMTKVTMQVDYQEELSLFSPARTQAPVLSHYEDMYFGHVYDSKYKHSVWTMDVPEGYSLSHGSRVIIKSNVVVEEAKPPQEAKSFWSSLAVYRNQQGVFLPTMTSNEDPAFWRILKSEGGSEQEIKDGGAIRLCWRFSDQRGGFRDFYEDSFGRRCYNRPDGMLDTLYLKVPFPRFEKTTSEEGISLIMSTIDSPGKGAMEQIKVLPKDEKNPQDFDTITYNLHDLVLRLDSVGHKGKGESSDYMMAVSDQSKTTLEHVKNMTTEHVGRNVQQVKLPEPERVVANIIGAIFPVIGVLQAIFL